jgi:hypothetical protein
MGTLILDSESPDRAKCLRIRRDKRRLDPMRSIKLRPHSNPAPLPRISGLTQDERLALEHELVDRSIRYASDHLGLF